MTTLKDHFKAYKAYYFILLLIILIAAAIFYSKSDFYQNLTGDVTKTNLGTITVNQNDGLGAILLKDTKGGNPITIKASSYTAKEMQTGDYVISVVPPAGYNLSTVTDINKKGLIPPYTQTLISAGTIFYNVNYKPVTETKNLGSITVNQNGGLGAILLKDTKGRNPITIKASPYTAKEMQTGDYVISVEPPAGYNLSTVTDINKKELIPPYKQTLISAGTIFYNVNYKPVTK